MSNVNITDGFFVVNNQSFRDNPENRLASLSEDAFKIAKEVKYIVPKGKIVIDADSAEAAQKVDALLKANGIETFSYETSYGHRHYWFNVPERHQRYVDMYKLNSNSKMIALDEKIDTRSCSSTGQTGAVYLKSNGKAKSNRPSPSQLLEAIKTLADVPLYLLHHKKLGEIVKGGEGWETEALKTISKMKFAEYPIEDIQQVFKEVANLYGEQHEEANIQRKFEEAYVVAWGMPKTNKQDMRHLDDYEDKLNNSILHLMEEKKMFGKKKVISKLITVLKTFNPKAYLSEEPEIIASGLTEVDYFIEQNPNFMALNLPDKLDVKKFTQVISDIHEIKETMAELEKNKLNFLPPIHHLIDYKKQLGSNRVKAKDVFDWNKLLRIFMEEAGFVKINDILKHKDENKLVLMEDLHRSIHKTIFNLGSTLENNIYQKIFKSAESENIEINPEEIVFKNGKLNVYTMEFIPGIFKSINTIPHNYDPNAKSAYGREILDRYVGDNKGFDTQIFEATGLMMMQDRGKKFKCAIFADGPSNYGKNFIFDEMIMPAIGTENIGGFELNKIDEPTQLTKFVHKTAVYDSDTDNTTVKSSAKATFKRITGGTRCTAKILYKDLFEFDNYATMWISCNGVPKMNDQGSGGATENRMHVIKFTVPVKQKYDDPHIFKRIKKESDEISRWLIAKSVKAIHDALIRGKLTQTELTQDAVSSEYDNDPFHRWASVYFTEIYDEKPKKADELFKNFLCTFEQNENPAGDVITGINYGFKRDLYGRKGFVGHLKDHGSKYGYEWRDKYQPKPGEHNTVTESRSWVVKSGSPTASQDKEAFKVFDRIFS